MQRLNTERILTSNCTTVLWDGLVGDTVLNWNTNNLQKPQTQWQQWLACHSHWLNSPPLVLVKIRSLALVLSFFVCEDIFFMTYLDWYMWLVYGKTRWLLLWGLLPDLHVTSSPRTLQQESRGGLLPGLRSWEAPRLRPHPAHHRQDTWRYIRDSVVKHRYRVWC